MKKTILAISGLSMLMGCAQPNSTVLPPYKLADGRVYQDVVSIGADGNGTAPTVTVLNTYAIGGHTEACANRGTHVHRRGAKPAGGVAQHRVTRSTNTASAGSMAPVTSASASQPGVWNIAVAGASAGLAGAALTNAIHHASNGSGVIITNNNSNSQSQAQNQSQDQFQSMP